MPCRYQMDVPDIQFRFRLAGYLTIFCYPVPGPVKILTGTKSEQNRFYWYMVARGRIVQPDNLQVPTMNHIDYYKILFNNLSSMLHIQIQQHETIQQNRST